MFHGSIVAIVTPMKTSGEVDFDSMANLIDWHIENQTDGLVVLGTTGESATINSDERRKLISFSIKHVRERIPVIVGTGTNSTASSIHMTNEAMELGADAALLVTPYYNKPTQNGLYLHYKSIAESVALPQILYNVPGRTGCDMLPETVCRLSSISNIVGVKEATGDIERVTTIKKECGDAIDILSGDDATAFDLMKAGGKGVISVTANVAPQQMHNLCAACMAGDFETARQINERLMPLHQKLFVESNPIPTKWALHEMGRIPEGIRMPLTMLAEQQHSVVREALQQSGIM